MQADTSPYLPVNHVFADFENLKTIDGEALGRKNFTFHLFLGPLNKTLPVEAVARMMENAQAVTMIRSPKSGKNAVDFVLAYHLGQAVLADPKGYFHLLSADTGFDSLVELLRSRKLKVKRHATWDELKVATEPKVPVIPPPPPAIVPPPARRSLSPGAEKLLENLRKAEKNRPKKRTTLVSHAKSSLGKHATDAEGEAAVEELRKTGKLKIDEKGAVTYKV